MDRRRSSALGWAVLAAVLAGCPEKTEPIRVGWVGGLTGRNYDLGISSRNGASLAVEEINAAGGIRGRQLELLVRDDAQDPETARSAVEGLVVSGVVSIVGPTTSAMAAVALPIANRERVLMISPTVSSSAFLGKDDWFVMLYPSTAASAPLLASHVAGRGLRRATAFLDLSNEAFSRTWHDEFAADFEGRGGKILRTVPFSSGAVGSYLDLVREGLDPRSDVVLVIASALDTASIAQQIRKLSKVQIVGTDWSLTNDLVVHGGSAVEGALFTQKVDPFDVSPRYVRFREAYGKRFSQEVDFAAVLSHDAVNALAEGLRKDASREGVRGAILEKGKFEGLQGEYRIDRFGDVERRQFVVTVRNGKTSAVE